MKIACIQFAPRVGDVNGNISRVDELLDAASPADLDVIVLPELGFLGALSLSTRFHKRRGRLWANSIQGVISSP